MQKEENVIMTLDRNNSDFLTDESVCKNHEDVALERSTRCKRGLRATWHVVISVVVGFVFGWAMEKSRVTEPSTVQEQFMFKRFIMLKVFMSAMLSSLIVIWFVSEIFTDTYTPIFKSFKRILAKRPLWMIIVGATTLGIGMFLSGSCPGIVLIQAGSGVRNSWITLLGCLFGTFIYTYLYDEISLLRKIRWDCSKSLMDILPVRKCVIRLSLIALLITAIIILERFISWREELKLPIVFGKTLLTDRAWLPSASGIVIGLCQCPSLLLMHRSLTGTGVYMNLVSQLYSIPYFKTNVPCMAQYHRGMNCLTTVVFSFGIIFGGLCSAISSGSLGVVEGVKSSYSFVGGALMLIGARLAGGCTSAHGISGTGHLFIGSFIATFFMFFGGGIAALIFKD